MKVIIVGAGISGLIAARELIRAGLSVVLIEARAVPGGRIKTQMSTRHQIPIDLGPEFAHGNPPETRALVADAERRIIKLIEAERIFWNDRVEPFDGGVTERVFANLKPSQTDESAARAFAHMDLDPRTRAMTIAAAEGFNAAEIDRLSVNALVGEMSRAREDLMENWRLRDGYSSVIERLTTEISMAEVRLSQRVCSVEWRKGRVTCGLDTGEPISGERLICTIPTSCFGDIEFGPELPGHVAAARQLPMGDVQKVTFIMRKPLWNLDGDVNIDYLHSPELTFNIRWTWGWVKPFVLTCWSGGGRAKKLRDLGATEVIACAVAELAQITKRPIDELRGLIEETYYHDWVNDPFSRGAYSYATVGGETARTELARPVAETLFFAGEATDNNGAAGTVQGALRAGLRAAQQVVSSVSV